LGNGANALQGAPQQARQITNGLRARERVVLVRRVVRSRQDPSLVRRARGIRTHGDKIPANLDDALAVGGLLRDDIAENAPLFLMVVVEARAQFVQDAPGY